MERNGEGAGDAEVEHFHPFVARIIGSNGQLQITGQRSGRGAERKGAAVHPYGVVEQENAAVGQWTLNGGRQVGCISDVEDDAGRCRVEMEGGRGCPGDRGVLPPGEAHDGR